MKKKKEIESKVKNKGLIVLFLEYPEEHNKDTYRVLKLSNRQVFLSRDITWTKAVYANIKGHTHTEDTLEDLIL